MGEWKVVWDGMIRRDLAVFVMDWSAREVIGLGPTIFCHSDKATSAFDLTDIPVFVSPPVL